MGKLWRPGSGCNLRRWLIDLRQRWTGHYCCTQKHDTYVYLHDELPARY